MFKLSIIKDNIKDNFFEYLFYLFVFLLPWQTRWIVRDYFIQGEIFEYGRISLYAFDIILVVLLLYYFVVQLLNKADRIKGGKRGYFFSLLVFLYFSVFVLLSTFWANDKLVSLYWGIRMLAGLGLFYLIRKVNFSKVRLAVVVVMAGAMQGLLAIWQFLTQEIWGSKWLGIAEQSAREVGASVVEFGLERWLRAYGSLSHPNILGALLVLSFVGVIYLTLRVENKLHKLFLIFSSSFIWLGIFFSFSRAAWIAFGLIYIIGFIYIWTKGSAFVKRFARGLWIYAAILLIVFTWAALPIVKTRLHIGPPNRLEMKSNIERLNSYKQAGEIIKEDLFFGVGMGNYTFALQQKYPEIKVWDIQPVHNTYLLMLSELGIFGILIIGLAVSSILVALVRRKKWSFVFMFLCLSVLMLFDHFWWTLGSGLYVLWLVMGLVTKAIETTNKKKLGNQDIRY